MKPKKHRELHKQLILCSCYSPEHQMIFTFWDDDWEPEIEFTVHLCKKNLWGRIRRGVEYIFGHQCRYGDWDEVLLRSEQVEEIRDIMNLFLLKNKEWHDKNEEAIKGFNDSKAKEK